MIKGERVGLFTFPFLTVSAKLETVGRVFNAAITARFSLYSVFRTETTDDSNVPCGHYVNSKRESEKA